MEPHDLMLAKLAANRERDWEFTETAIRFGIVEVAVLRERAQLMPRSHHGVQKDLEGTIRRAQRPQPPAGT